MHQWQLLKLCSIVQEDSLYIILYFRVVNKWFNQINHMETEQKVHFGMHEWPPLKYPNVNISLSQGTNTAVWLIESRPVLFRTSFEDYQVLSPLKIFEIIWKLEPLPHPKLWLSRTRTISYLPMEIAVVPSPQSHFERNWENEHPLFFAPRTCNPCGHLR